MEGTSSETMGATVASSEGPERPGAMPPLRDAVQVAVSEQPLQVLGLILALPDPGG